MEEALAINPNNPYALLNMGVVYENTGRSGEARRMFQKVIDLDAIGNAMRSNEDWARGKEPTEVAKRNQELL